METPVNYASTQVVSRIPVTTWRDGTVLTTANESVYLGAMYGKENGAYFKYSFSDFFPVSLLAAYNQASFVKLLNDFGTDIGTILLDKILSVTSTMVIPENVVILFEQGCYFNTSANVYVDIRGIKTVDIEWFGAVADGVVTIATGSISTNVLTVNSALFTTADVGKALTVKGAASSSQNLVTTISAVNSSTEVVLAGAAVVAVTNADVSFGTDNSNALMRFNAWAKNVNGLVIVNFQPNKIYLHKTPRWVYNILQLKVNINGSQLRNITYNGYDRYSLVPCSGITSQTKDGEVPLKVNYYLINAVDEGSTTIVTTTATDAANLVVGEWVLIGCEDIRLSGTPPDLKRFDFARILAADSGTGNVTLDRSIKFSYKLDALWSTAANTSNGYTGKAAVYRIEQGSKWGIDHEYNDGIFFAESAAGANYDYTIASGLKVRFNNCQMRAFDPTMAEYVESNNCSALGSEFDKLVTHFTDYGSTWPYINGASGIRNLTFNNSVLGPIDVNSRNLTFNNCTQSGTPFKFGAREGSVDRFIINGGTYETAPGYTLTYGQIKKVQLGVSSVTYTNGVLTVPTTAANINFLGVAFAGKRIEVVGSNATLACGLNNYGTITQVSSDGTNTLLSVVFKNVLTGNEVLMVYEEPLFTRISDCTIAGAYVAEKNFVMIAGYIKIENFTVPAAAKNFSIIGGAARKITVNVRKPYTGTTTNAILTITGSYPATTTADATVIDLTQAGVRERTATGATGFVTGSLDSGATALNVTDNYYKSSYSIGTVGSLAGTADDLPIVDVYIENNTDL